jgi:hypothetical protein
MGGGQPLLCAATSLSAFKAKDSNINAITAVTMIAALNETVLNFTGITVGSKVLELP